MLVCVEVETELVSIEYSSDIKITITVILRFVLLSYVVAFNKILFTFEVLCSHCVLRLSSH